jgi:hypothetical membrane protein
MTQTRSWIAGATCWVLKLSYFVAQPVVAAAWDPPYSFTGNTISALGNAACGSGGTGPCSPRHLLMNATFVLVGLLTMAGTYLLRGYWPRCRLTTWGLALIGLSGAGAVLVGLAPADVNLPVHAAGAFLQVTGAAGPLLLGLATTGRPATRVFSIVAGIIGTVASVLFLSGPHLGLGTGGMERLGFDPLTVWTIVIGATILLRRRFG